MRSDRLRSQASLAVLLATVTILIVVSALVSTITINNYINIASSKDATQALLLADSAMEDALLGLHRTSAYSSNTFSVPEGNVTITITDLGGGAKSINVTTSGLPVLRSIDAEITLSGQTVSPFSGFATFAADDVYLESPTAQIVGELWSNDNVWITDDATIYGNVYTSGAGSTSKTRILDGASVLDDPATPEIEGNVTAIDDIWVYDFGTVYGTATSRDDVETWAGGSVGSAVENQTGLVLATKEVPVFDYDTYRTQAQTEGTYFTSPSQFLNYLQLNGDILSGGVYYIDTNQNLIFPTGRNFNITGTIISEDDIYVRATSYVHNAENNLPTLVSDGHIYLEDSSFCDCTATINGILYAERDIVMRHDQYTGSQAFAVVVNGATWAGDDVYIEDRSQLILNSMAVNDAFGFNFTGVVGTDNIVVVDNWGIN